ncbi:TetR/AcrR family transcriptional regulator [Gordonia sp. PDNC005]|uniref:TetR/AcrR family transcriptional regulator n=1 Tax=unclassified Gordonia (in: high G+C Gram-positive bacteria) TaxID=2657482 RepID=UPI0019647608|nr:TetR/AcrR family transcriptional regulator [Gordonia sp. PDNC005]QRY62191.1 TetR/AcrR family transcriptional regulator [Gordonia sp. PDNC005]
MATIDPVATPGRRQSKSETTRARIITAAAKVLAETGFGHTRLSAIADEAGMQIGSLYYYFGSKDELVEAALDEAGALVHRAVYSAVDDLPATATPGERLSAAVRSFIRVRIDVGNMSAAHIRNYRDVPKEMRDRLRPALEQFSEFWASLVRDAAESGEIRSDIDPRILHMFVFHTSEQITKWPAAIKTSTADTVDVMHRLILAGLHPSTEQD